MMNPEWKAKWVAALRSGQYAQAQQRLRTPEGYCCLGVVCDIVKDEVEGEWREQPGHFNFRSKESTFVDENSVNLPNAVAGLIDLPVGEESNLIQMNDGGSTFAEIADYIESHL